MCVDLSRTFAFILWMASGFLVRRGCLELQTSKFHHGGIHIRAALRLGQSPKERKKAMEFRPAAFSCASHMAEKFGFVCCCGRIGLETVTAPLTRLPLFAVVLMRREVLYNPLAARRVIDFCKALVVVAHTARQFITAVM